MAAIAGVDKVLVPWLEAEPDQARRVAVANAILWAGETKNLETIIHSWQAVDGHPRRRAAEVADAGVVLVFVTHTLPPLFGLELVDIQDTA